MPGTTALLNLPYPIPDDGVDVPRDIKALADKLDPSGASGLFIIGEVRFIAITATPAGWRPCDGAALSRATYAALFAAIGVVYGPGDGSSTFNVPDLRGRSPAGTGTGAGLTARAAGAKWGAESVTLAMTHVPAHNHGGGNHYNAYYAAGSIGAGPVDGGWVHMANASGAAAGLYGTQYSGIIIATEGGGQAHENTSPALGVPAYIYAGA